MENSKQSLPRTIFGMMINPSGTLKNDLYKTGQKGLNFVLLSGATGVVYGLCVIPLVGFFIWILIKLFISDRKVKETISSFCLSYSGALVYGVLGIVFSLVLGWKTSVAFGVTGVLWAIGPMMISIRELTGGKSALSVFIATAVGAMVLVSWSIFGNL